MTYAAIELGGTKALVCAGTGPNDHVLAPAIATADAATTLAEVAGALEGLEREFGPFEAIGVASFGPLQLDTAASDYGRFLTTPKPGWSGVDLVKTLQAAVDAPLTLETDVNAAALAEGRWGSAAGLDDHAYITVGTGVGVGLVVGGHPVHGGGHPEGGHLPVRSRPDDPFPGACLWHGRCVEGLVSGPALQARLGRPGAEIVVDDPVWELCGDYLAQLCAALVLLTAPRRIVLGGGVGQRPELLAAVRRNLQAHLNGYVDRLASEGAIAGLVVPAALEHAGLMGGLLLAQSSPRRLTPRQAGAGAQASPPP
jgi:fructokinase